MIDFEGQTVVCVASGPSLAAEDCEWVRRSGLPTIAVNSSWRLAPFCTVLYAGDCAWWDAYGKDVNIDAERWTCSRSAHVKHGINLHPVAGAYNSGARAIEFAIDHGASNVILLGYDCSLDDGVHWHGPHDATENPTTHKVELWRRHFKRVAEIARKKNVQVVNASRKTALECFERVELNAQIAREPIYIHGMHGMGDNLHQRSIVRTLMQDHDVWLETPWPSIYHDLDIHVVSKGSKLRTQAKNAAREADLFEHSEPPKGARELRVSYSPDRVRQCGSVLAAMSKQCNLPTGDFRLPVPQAWIERVPVSTDKPILVYRPLVERREWTGCRNRNPDAGAYHEIFQSMRDGFFVVSVADLVGGEEWMTSVAIEADATFHKGELDFQQLSGLFAMASLVYTAPGFGVVLAQAVETPVIAVFGGYEDSQSFRSGNPTPYLGIDTVNPCRCFSHSHRCEKRINMNDALTKTGEFLEHIKAS